MLRHWPHGVDNQNVRWRGVTLKAGMALLIAATRSAATNDRDNEEDNSNDPADDTTNIDACMRIRVCADARTITAVVVVGILPAIEIRGRTRHDYLQASFF